ncbi:MAG: hypothetical protein AAF664_17575 [Planctomycetota bacterium]
MNKPCGFALAIVAFLMLAPNTMAQAQLNDRLKNALKRYPDADLNNDGVLSVDEARAYRYKMKGKKTPATPANESIDTASYDQPADLKEGARCLFLGHSFFIPVAKRFDEMATEIGLSHHHASFVLKGNAGGAPGRIWSSSAHRSAATKILETGNIHLLGMTYFDESNCKVEDYERWIDLAIQHNPKVHIFIGLCWPDAPEASVDDFSRIIRGSNERLFKTVKTLRGQYPETKIQFVNYGLVARELKDCHASGRLSEIGSLVSRDSGSLFRDTKGHAGPLLLDLAALTWLDQLYEVDAADVKTDVVRSDAARAILPVVAKFNEQFRYAQ